MPGRPPPPGGPYRAVDQRGQAWSRSAPVVAGSAARQNAAVRSSTSTASRSALARSVTGNGRAYAGAVRRDVAAAPR